MSYYHAMVKNNLVPMPDIYRKRALKVMLVEDNTADAFLTHHALNAAEVPVEITQIRCGDAFIEQIRAALIEGALPDLILLDLGLPGTDGFEILEQLSKMPADVRAIPVVVLTGYTNFEYLQQTYAVNVIAYLTKPCHADTVQAILQRIAA